MGRERSQNAAGCPELAHGMPETLLSVLPARQAESRMVESQGQANGHCDPKPKARRTDLSGNGWRMWLRPRGWEKLKTPTRTEVLLSQLVSRAETEGSEMSDSEGAEITRHELAGQQAQQLMPAGPWRPGVTREQRPLRTQATAPSSCHFLEASL